MTKLGFSLLYESNCAKDVGPTLIILDQAIGNMKDIKNQWKQLLTNGLVTGMLSYQSFKDCKDAYDQIRDIWSRS